MLRYCGDLSEAEVADAMGCSVGTMKSQLAKTLSALDRLLRDVEDPSVVELDARLRKGLGSSLGRPGATDPGLRKIIIFDISHHNENRRLVAAGVMVVAVLVAATGALAVVSLSGIGRPVG